MLKSKIYSNHFPVKSYVTSFNEDEKRTLCKWATVFKTEVLAREIEKSNQGYRYYPSYNLDKYDEKIMVDMINQNCFDDRYLLILNIIIYRHKYNAFLSIWLFPILSKTQVDKYFGDMIS